MKINVLNLIDFEEVNKLLEGFNQSTGFVTAILDLDGNVLSKSGWRKLCTHFHRINPESSKNCTISDTVLANELAKGEKYHFYKCLNGLVDVAVPIVVKGEHVANLFSGQFFFEKPNRTFFENQAERYGFDKQEYLDALEKVPVVSKEKVKIAMEFLLNMTQLISEITYKKLEQIQLNEELLKSEERFRSAFDHMLEGCQIIGFDWRYIYLNHSAQTHNRRPNAELIGNRYQDMWPGIEQTAVFKKIEKVLKTRIPLHFENEFEYPDGTIGWFDLSIQTVPEGVFILSLDISERKKTELALLESEKKYRLIADNSDDWIYWAAPNGELLYISPACERVTGYSIEEFTSHPNLNQEIVYEADKTKLIEHHNISHYNKIQHELEYRIITKEGEIRWISHTCSQLYNDKGDYLGQRGTNRNITSRKEAEIEISKLNDTLEQRVIERTSQLEAANKELEAFSYSVSHDLRAPLRHINGFVDLLNEKYLEILPEKARHYLNTISGASKQMGTLIDDLLQFSRTGRQELHKTLVDMNGLVEEVIERMNPEIINRKIVWNIQRLPESYCDSSLIKLVWANLLDNAIKYTKYREVSEISIEFKNEGSSCIYYVRDNGVGFDMKYAHKLFGVFQRLHSQTDFEGTGIGLANVQRIIHKHNGRVWAESEPDKGSTFYFSLPNNKEK